MLKRICFLMMLPATVYGADCESLTTYQRIERSAPMSVKPKVTSGKPAHPSVVYKKPANVPSYKKVVKNYDCLSSSPKVTPPGTLRIGNTFFHGIPFVWGAPPFDSPEPIFTYPAALNFGPAYPSTVPSKKPEKPNKPEHPEHPEHPVKPPETVPPVIITPTPTGEPPTATVPEPAPLSLLLLGIGMLAILRVGSKH